MNDDDYCEQITVPNCDSGRFEDNNDELKKKANTAYALYTYQNGYINARYQDLGGIIVWLTTLHVIHPTASKILKLKRAVLPDLHLQRLIPPIRHLYK